jgi:hypothetical protein
VLLLAGTAWCRLMRGYQLQDWRVDLPQGQALLDHLRATGAIQPAPRRKAAENEAWVVCSG